ncbi:MAG: hypothetical protein HY334_04590 [Armatimonadetes bacterium]|nr:hypothetical protein [Armatimonadota bacterium]
MATAIAPRADPRRTAFGLPAPRRRRAGLAWLGWAVVLLAGLTMGWRAFRWADRNL